jgi:N-acetylmuramoyl-L-alanine amidase
MKKKFVLIILALLITVLNVNIAKADPEQILVYTNTEGVNVRGLPSLQGSIIEKLSFKTFVLKLGTSKDSEGNLWNKIYDFNTNKTGFVASWLLNNSGITIKGEDSNFTAKNKAEYLNVRIGPGREFKIASTLAQNAKINVIRVISRSDDEEWYKFKGTDGKYYFVAAWYMEEVKETPVEIPETQSTISATSTDYVNLRSGPSTDFIKIALVEKGEKVVVTGIAKNRSGETWLQIEYKSQIGWVYSIYFTTQSFPNIDTSPIGCEGTTTDSVNIREGPSTEQKSLIVLGKNEKIKILGIALNKEKEIWYEIKNNNLFGWIRSDLVNIVKKEKGVLNELSWVITSSGIDILIVGEKLPQPEVALLENPLRLAITYENTSILSDKPSIEVNIYPITRVRYEIEQENINIVADLVRELPYTVEYKDNTKTAIHFVLPKINEKYVEVAGREIYASLRSLEGETYIDLADFERAFDLKIDEKLTFTLYGHDYHIDTSKIKREDSSSYISLGYLKTLINASIFETAKEIYIDPVLEDYKESESEKMLTFSFPPKAKRLEEGNRYYFLFYAEGGSQFDLNTTPRSQTNPPVIKIEVSKDSNLDVTANVVKISQRVVKTGTLSGKVILVDPGHGSYNGPYLDVGAIGPTGVKEAYVVMAIALKVKELFEDEGAKVILTHKTVDDPSNPTLAERVTIANSSGGDLFISIHLNASLNESARGTETYYWFESSKKFAKEIQDALIGSMGTADRGIKKEYLYLCGNVTTMPAILTEVVFVSNPGEENLCKQDSFIYQVALAIKKGVENYLNGQ